MQFSAHLFSDGPLDMINFNVSIDGYPVFNGHCRLME